MIGFTLGTTTKGGESLTVTLKNAAIAVALAVAMFLTWSLGVTTHMNDADARTFAQTNGGCTHSAQSLHEFTPPAHYPGTRAAHRVTWNLSFTVVTQVVYTKSSIFDPTWDYYFANSVGC